MGVCAKTKVLRQGFGVVQPRKGQNFDKPRREWGHETPIKKSTQTPSFHYLWLLPGGSPHHPLTPLPVPYPPSPFPSFRVLGQERGTVAGFFFAVFLLVVRSYPFWAVLGGGRVNFHPSAESGSVTAHMADEQVLIVPKTPQVIPRALFLVG